MRKKENSMFGMRRYFRKTVLAGMICLGLLVVLAAPVMASTGVGQTAVQRPDTLQVVLDLALSFGGLVGVAGVITVLVNLLKLIGWVADGTSDTWIAVLNLVAFVTLAAIKVFNPQITTAILDEQAARLATLGVFALGYLTQIIGSKQIYKLIRGLPIIGKTFSG
jgi:hypothetical protein